MSTSEWFTLIGFGIGVAGALLGWILSLHGRLSRAESKIESIDSLRGDVMKLLMHLVDEWPGRDKP